MFEAEIEDVIMDQEDFNEAGQSTQTNEDPNNQNAQFGQNVDSAIEDIHRSLTELKIHVDRKKQEVAMNQEELESLHKVMETLFLKREEYGIKLDQHNKLKELAHKKYDEVLMACSTVHGVQLGINQMLDKAVSIYQEFVPFISAQYKEFQRQKELDSQRRRIYSSDLQELEENGEKIVSALEASLAHKKMLVKLAEAYLKKENANDFEQEKELICLKEKLNYLIDQKEHLESSVKKMEERRSVIIAQHNQKMQTLEADRKAKLDELDTISRMVDCLKTEVTTSEHKLDNLNQQYNQMVSELKECELSIRENDLMNGYYKRRLEAAQSKVYKKVAEVEKRKQNIKQLKHYLETLVNRRPNIAHLEARHNRLSEESSPMEQDVNEWREKEAQQDSSEIVRRGSWREEASSESGQGDEAAGGAV